MGVQDNRQELGWLPHCRIPALAPVPVKAFAALVRSQARLRGAELAALPAQKPRKRSTRPLTDDAGKPAPLREASCAGSVLEHCRH